MCAEGSGKQKSPYCSWIAFGSRGERICRWWLGAMRAQFSKAASFNLFFFYFAEDAFSPSPVAFNAFIRRRIVRKCRTLYCAISQVK